MERMWEASIAFIGSTSLRDDAVSQVLGVELPRRVCGCVLGVTPSSVDSRHHQSQKDKYVEEKIRSLTQEVDIMRTEMRMWSQRVVPMDRPMGPSPDSREGGYDTMHFTSIG